MKNKKDQIVVAILCLILGFAITYQYKDTKANNETMAKREYVDLTDNISYLEKRRDAVMKEVDSEQKKVDAIEREAAGDNTKINDLKTELDRLKKKAGLTDLQGPGVEITLSMPDKLEFEENQLDYLENMQKYIISIINDLNSIKAEGISINDERYVTRSRIKISGSFIEINGTQYSPVEKFIIKAVCNINAFEKMQNIPRNTIEEIRDMGYNVDVNKEDKLKVSKYNKALTLQKK